MTQVRNWTQISSYLVPAEHTQAKDGICVIIEELAQLIRDAGLIERADLIARTQVAQLEDMIASCEHELDVHDGEAALGLDDAIAELRNELADRRALLSLEDAFRDDQRDAVRERLDSLYVGLNAGIDEALLSTTVLERSDIDALLRVIMACDAEQVFRSAREQARKTRQYWASGGDRNYASHWRF